MYAHFRKEFGARRDDCLQYVHNGNEDFMQVNFELGVKTDNFKAGINRLDKALSQNRTIALMCTGANPRLREVSTARFVSNNGWWSKIIAHFCRK